MMRRILGFVRRIPRIPHRIYWEIQRGIPFCYFQLLNFFGNAAVTAQGGPVVSLTSFGGRIRRAHLAIESIGRGCLLPSRMILWLDDGEASSPLPAALQRLVRRGLEIKFCNDYGPHKKYYPYLESLEVIQTPLVTADDDLFYPHTWLKKLVEASEHFPDVVNCYRARVMELNPEGIAEYGSWGLTISTNPSFRNVAGNGAGAIYLPHLQSAFRKVGSGFMSCCAKADDLWLHVQTLRAGVKVRQIRRKEFVLVEIPGSQIDPLKRQNVLAGDNDRQIAATYTAEDIQILMKEGGSS